MKQVLLYGVGFILLVLTGCTPTLYPVAHTYQLEGYEFNSKLNKEEIWDKTIAFFISKGMTFKSLLKEEGLITTDPASLLDSYTEEDQYGQLRNPYAFVVINRYSYWYSPGSAFAVPVQLTGQWVVWIRENKDATSRVQIKLANATGRYSQGPPIPIPTIRSTGIFEFSLENLLNE